jgi:hypothetical protein
MNANAIARHYAGSLTPEERFRLILAASGRGDEAERTRLASAAPRIALATPDHFPCSQAFHELSLLIFIELLDTAAHYAEALALADDEPEAGEAVAPEDEAEPTEQGARKRPAWQRFLDLALGFGYMLRVKARGWQLFCERLNVPPFQVWQLGPLPGFARLQRCLTLAEKAAFTAEGFLTWANRIRPAGEPERADVPLTAEGIADATEAMFRERAAWWGGEAPYRP